MSLGQIRPMIKKNLIVIKRNIAKSLLQLFYPTIILLFFISILMDEKKNKRIPEQNYLNYQKDYSLKTILDNEYKGHFTTIAIVGDNNTNSDINLKNLQEFLKTNCIDVFIYEIYLVKLI